MLVIKPTVQLSAVFSCDFKIEKNAKVWLDFREQENRREFPVGPSLTFDAKTGKIMAGRKQIGESPVGAWFPVEIKFPVNGGPVYSLRVGKEKTYEKLPFDNPEYAKCGWIGMIGTGNEAARFYIDNLKLCPAENKSTANFGKSRRLVSRRFVPKEKIGLEQL